MTTPESKISNTPEKDNFAVSFPHLELGKEQKEDDVKGKWEKAEAGIR